MISNRAKLEFRAYARPFQAPLQTHHGKWWERRGIVLRLENELGIGWGEIAPIPDFGSESWETAQAYCRSLPEIITSAQIRAIPAQLTACQFGFESAWESLHRSPLALTPIPSSLLLPSGTAALESPLLFQSAQAGSRSGRKTFKWKIGVDKIEYELAIFEELLGLLPAAAKLRLDANGGLSWQQASLWLQICDSYGIEFLEQPLPPAQFELMLKLSQRYTTPIALDESVTGLTELKACYERGWRSIFVIKAPLAGSPVQLRQFCQDHKLDLVWSSVFETSIARRYIENYLIAALPASEYASERANGFGVEHWFRDGWERLSPEQIWQRLA
jgi:o-succinylbenzoate synthase